MRLSQLSDEGLFDKVRQGETAAFQELYARYEGKLFAFIYRYLQNQQSAEDVFHQAFLKVLNDNQVSFENGSFRGWIYCVSRNLCLNKLRSEKREQKANKLYLVSSEDPEKGYEREMELAQDLKEAVKKLPHLLYEVYSLRVLGLSYEEMAKSLGIPLGTVKSRMHEMVKVLKKEIEACNAS